MLPRFEVMMDAGVTSDGMVLLYSSTDGKERAMTAGEGPSTEGTE